VKCIINNQVVLSRAPEGPLALHIGPFARSLSEEGYALNSIQRQVLLAACFSRWLKQLGVALRRITSDHPPRYLRYRARQVRPYLGVVAALRHLLDFLRSEGVIPWLAQRSSTTFRSSAVFSRIVSATDPSHCHICVPVTSSDLYSVRHRVCIRSERSS
jgi:hypothetical protein